MSEKEIIQQDGVTGKENIESEAVQKTWFYTALLSSGTVSKGSAESAAEFSELFSSATIIWVDYVIQDTDFDKKAHIVAEQIGFSQNLTSSITSKSYLNYDDLDTELGMKVPSIQVRGLEVEAYPLLLFCRKNFVLTIHPVNVDRRFTRLRRYAETVLKKIPANASTQDKLTILLSRIIDHNNDRNFEHLRQIEERENDLSETFMDYSVPGTELAPKIHQMKRALLIYLNALWDSLDVLHALRNGDAELITDDPLLLSKLGILADDVRRQLDLAEHMSEVLASGLEALQSIYNNQLQNTNNQLQNTNNQLQSTNNRLSYIVTYLTIVGTAILVPNTIATILGDTTIFSDLSPKDHIWYWPLMIGATVVSTFLSYWWVRKKGLMSKKMD
jgi:magnesium transporter